MKAFPDLALKPIIDEILATVHQVNTLPVPVESKTCLSPVELRRYVRNLRKTRQTGIY
ncbi:MAG TPA: hypothetical protein G4O16_03645 [Dehalococcoidia bacterium]|nr:hypothetical protein [Dehalococcoidia bacterium]